MNIQDIISKLREMQSAYTIAINQQVNFNDLYSYKGFLETHYLINGFCTWLFDTHIKISLPVLKNLSIDREKRFSPSFELWYNSPSAMQSIEDIVESCLKPRLDNINRTIDRLEKQLQPNNK